MNPSDAFEAGLAAWRQGQYFDAHEHWEQVWQASRDEAEREALKGLIQLAASLHKHRQGALSGHGKLWVKARPHLIRGARVLKVLHGVDLQGFVARLPEAPAPVAPSLNQTQAGFGVVYLHGFGSSPDSPKAQAITAELTQAGVPVVAPCLADADDFFDFTVTRSLARARHALFDRTLLVGSSLGGWTGALLANKDHRIVEMVLMCPAFRLAQRWSEQTDAIRRWRAHGQADFEVGHPPALLPLSVDFIEDALRHDGTVEPSVFTTVFHGSRDDVVPLSDVEQTVAGLPHVQLHVVDDDHGLRATLLRIARLCRDRAQTLA